MFPDYSKYITTNEFNKFSSEIFDERLKKAKLASANNLNTVKQHATKNEEKIVKLKIYDSCLFNAQSYFGNDGSHNFLVFQSI